MAEHQQSGSSGQSGQGSGQRAGDGKPQLSWGQPAQQGAAGQKAGTASTAAPVQSAPSSRLIGTFAAGLIIGLLIAWAWFDLRGGDTTGSTSATGTSSSEFAITKTGGQASSGAAATGTQTGAAPTQTGPQGTAVSGAAITVPASQKAGYTVEVSSLAAPEAVWAVVYSNADRSGRIMGAARFAARRSGTIELVHPTVAGKTYYVGLVADTANHAYSSKVNKPILGANGAQVMTQFTAQ